MNILELLKNIVSAQFLASVIRISTPLIFASMGGLISEKAGAINIALEGMMLSAAFTGVIVSHFTASAWLGLLGALISGLLVGLLLGFFHLYFKTNAILAGIAVNVICSGATVFLLVALTGEKGNSSSLTSYTLPNVNIPFIEKIPFVGTMLSGQNILTYLSLIMVVIVYIVMNKTALGRHLQAVGENPAAASSVGINVIRSRYIAYGLSGIIAAFGGANLSMGYLPLFQRDMTAGRGFIAVAAIFLGSKQPIPVFLAALFFGFSDALANQIGLLGYPAQFIQMIPYLATVLALIFAAKRAETKTHGLA